MKLTPYLNFALNVAQDSSTIKLSSVLLNGEPNYILTTLNGKFLQGFSPIEVYRASIKNEVCWPAFTTEKGGSWAKHEAGCERSEGV